MNNEPQGVSSGSPRSIAKTERIIPALGYHRLTGLYDPIVRWTTREATFKPRLLSQLLDADARRVLDLGCGTGSLTIDLRKRAPAAWIVGLDADHRILDLARRKAARANASVEFVHGSAMSLPFCDGRFDRVVSSLLFHHLLPQSKQRALGEVYRVLRPGGFVHIADWGKPSTRVMRLLFYGVQLLDGFATTQDSVAGKLVDYARQTGFADFRVTGRVGTAFGEVCLFSGRKTEGSG